MEQYWCRWSQGTHVSKSEVPLMPGVSLFCSFGDMSQNMQTALTEKT